MESNNQKDIVANVIIVSFLAGTVALIASLVYANANQMKLIEAQQEQIEKLQEHQGNVTVNTTINKSCTGLVCTNR